jgi:hypothetical protein
MTLISRALFLPMVQWLEPRFLPIFLGILARLPAMALMAVAMDGQSMVQCNGHTVDHSCS